jgi:hypothetical protein
VHSRHGGDRGFHTRSGTLAGGRAHAAHRLLRSAPPGRLLRHRVRRRPAPRRSDQRHPPGVRPAARRATGG